MIHTQPKRVLILMSMNGGGHRSVAKAIERGLLSISDGDIAPTVVDLFAVGRRSLLDNLVGLYSPIIVNSPGLWAFVYHAANGRRRFETLVKMAEPFLRQRVERLMAEHSPQVIVSVHPLTNHIITRLLGRGDSPVPLVSVLTDLVDVHAGWASRDSALCVAPTAAAAEALEIAGVRAESILALGLPIGPRFGAVEEEVAEVRVSLGLLPHKFTVLVVGGSEGAGGIGRVVESIGRSDLDAQVLVVCGKNERLRRQLDESRYMPDGRVFGFVKNMPELM
ncbi:MAG: hypothetical protein Q7O66_11620, partial [Dehalococcoidia bacterium]|nr:hypothetical protein [Dehalococcoidia bacterium]